MPDTIDPAIRAASANAAADAPGTQALDPLRKDDAALLASDPSSPMHALYRQAVQGLELLGGQRFRDRRELERIALQIAVHASAIGLARIDRVAASDDGAGYFFVDRQAVDPAMRGYLTHAEALQGRAPAQLVETQKVQVQQRVSEQAQRDAWAQDAPESRRRDPQVRSP